MSAVEQPEPLARRIEQLAAASHDGGSDDGGSGDPGALEARGGDVQELRREMTRALADLRDDVSRTVAHLRADLTTTTERLSATLARGLAELADEIDVAATTTRDASERVTVLAELTETQRSEVARLLHGVHDVVVDAGQGLREEMLARTAEQLGALERRLDELHAAVGTGAADVGERLGALDARVVHAARAVEHVAAGLEDVGAATDRLGDTVEAFRTEWPTRTYEVVQGARAVAEAVVLDVREEVGARLQDVRGTLEHVLGSVEQARSGLDAGTDRLAGAGHVLVAYLEQRDRLLEAERDRVLHDVLDAFAAGLSARERSALAARVSDVVVRRRDARDAERYREAVGEPVAPAATLPEDVLALVTPARAPVDAPQQPVRGGGGEPLTAPARAPETTAGAAPEVVGQPARASAAPASAGAATEARPPGAPAPRPTVARGGRGVATVVPGPGRATRAVTADAADTAEGDRQPS